MCLMFSSINLICSFFCSTFLFGEVGYDFLPSMVSIVGISNSLEILWCYLSLSSNDNYSSTFSTVDKIS